MIWILFPIERINNSSRVPAFKMIGVFLDENLNFEYHIKQTRNKISKALFPISKAKHVLSSSAWKSLYYALVHPLFLYCLHIYSSSSLKSLNSLFFLQRKCVRIISKSKFNAHTEPLFYSSQILPIHDLILQQKLLSMHSID